MILEIAIRNTKTNFVLKWPLVFHPGYLWRSFFYVLQDVLAAAPQVTPTQCSWRKGKVGKQSDGKSQARETKRVDLFILLCEPCTPSPFSFSLSHTHLKTPSCYCGHRHQDAIDRQDILFTTQSSRGWVWGLGSCRRQRSSPGQLQ